MQGFDEIAWRNVAKEFIKQTAAAKINQLAHPWDSLRLRVERAFASPYG
jgi:hypothetical protein